MNRAITCSLFAPALALLLGTASAEAAVKREGGWPEKAEKVSLDLEGATRAEAVRKLADAAGWSLVVQTPIGEESEPVTLHLKDQPVAKVLDLVLEDGWVATRDGTLVSLHQGPAADHEAREAQPPAPPAAAGATPPSAAVPATPSAGIERRAHGARGENREVTGGNLVIKKDETVHDVTVLGGSLEVLGNVTGDISVTGGEVVIRKGARVDGDVAGMGGKIEIEDGASVDGTVSVVGGTVHRGDKAQVGVVVQADTPEERDTALGVIGKVRHFLRELGSRVTRAAFLFMFGAILLALGAERMERMRGEVAARPMRSFAMGLVGLFLGLVGFVVLCVTVLGIPVALVALLLAVFGGYAGVVAVLTTVGEALARHRTQSPYVHLAIGCALFFLASSLPWLGDWVTAAVALTGVGAFVATRAAGYWPTKKVAGQGPYRTAA